MKLRALAIAISLMAMPVWAQQHLEPERSLYSGAYIDPEYEALVTSVLHAAYDRDVVVRLVVEPSFFPEYAIGIRGTPDHYRIFVLEPAAQLWIYASLKNEPKEEADKDKARLPTEDPHQLKVSSCERDISTDRAKRIFALWEKMLSGTRYPDPEEEVISSDGVSFHFSGAGLYGRAGRAHSPDPDSNAGLLVQIGKTMKDICEKNVGTETSELDRLAARLESKLR